MNRSEIPTPAILVDLDVVDTNIRTMVENSRKYGINHRPHIKTHKSVELAKRQVELGARGITCAKLGEAEVMAAAGFDDILVAFPLIGEDKLQRLQALLEQGITLRTIVNSEAGAAGIATVGERLGSPVEVLIEIDGGIDRGGLKPGEPAVEFARKIRNLTGIKVVGILYFGGGIGKKDSPVNVIEKSLRERDEIIRTAELLRAEGLTMDILSGGSSFSSKNAECLEGLTEVRAGTYIFNDVSQLVIGYARQEDCALTCIATVISRPDEYSAIIDAGSKTLTSETNPQRPGYGYIIEDPRIQIVKLNEEHGFLRSESRLKLSIGEKITIIPNHVCLLPNMVDEMYGMRGEKLEKMLKVDARGCNR